MGPARSGSLSLNGTPMSDIDRAQDLMTVAQAGLLAGGGPSPSSSQPHKTANSTGTGTGTGTGGSATTKKAPDHDSNNAPWLMTIATDIEKLIQTAADSRRNLGILRAQVALVEEDHTRQAAELGTLRALVARKLIDSVADGQDKLKEKKKKKEQKEQKEQKQRQDAVVPNGHHEHTHQDQAQSGTPAPAPAPIAGNVGAPEPPGDDSQGPKDDDGFEDAMQIDGAESSGTLLPLEPSQENNEGNRATTPRSPAKGRVDNRQSINNDGNKATTTSSSVKRKADDGQSINNDGNKATTTSSSAKGKADHRQPVNNDGNKATATTTISSAKRKADNSQPVNNNADSVPIPNSPAKTVPSQSQHPRKPQTAKRSGQTNGRMRSLPSGRPQKATPTNDDTGSRPLVPEPASPKIPESAIPDGKDLEKNDDGAVASPSLTHAQESAIRGIKEAIACLPRPPKLRVPESPVNFPPTFLRANVGGNAATFASVSDSMLGRQIIPCQELIKVNSAVHEHAPRTGYHGALTFVDGHPGSGQMGKKYPLFWKNGVNWEYGGIYTIAKRALVPLTIWKTWDMNSKVAQASKITTTGWGQDLLLEKGIVEKAADVQELTVDDILSYFERKKEPNLRMSWTLLQCVGYDRIQYDILAIALETWNEGQSQNDEPPETSTVEASKSKDSSRKRVTKSAAPPTPSRTVGKPSKPSTAKATHPTSDQDSGPVSYPSRKRLARTSPDEHQGGPVQSGRSKRPRPYVERVSREPSDDEMSDSITLRRGPSSPQSPSRARQAKRKDVDYRLLKPELDDVIFADESEEEEEEEEAEEAEEADDSEDDEESLNDEVAV
ncbi:MAG: hypothetical protein M1837_003560 [Sclerophora amabilis]|nr:MAG: hypothetical protein M1837_003560 [Sclerophora amabilis]